MRCKASIAIFLTYRSLGTVKKFFFCPTFHMSVKTLSVSFCVRGLDQIRRFHPNRTVRLKKRECATHRDQIRRSYFPTCAPIQKLEGPIAIFFYLLSTTAISPAPWNLITRQTIKRTATLTILYTPSWHVPASSDGPTTTIVLATAYNILLIRVYLPLVSSAVHHSNPWSFLPLHRLSTTPPFLFFFFPRDIHAQ